MNQSNRIIPILWEWFHLGWRQENTFAIYWDEILCVYECDYALVAHNWLKIAACFSSYTFMKSGSAGSRKPIKNMLNCSHFACLVQWCPSSFVCFHVVVQSEVLIHRQKEAVYEESYIPISYIAPCTWNLLQGDLKMTNLFPSMFLKPSLRTWVGPE